MPQNLNMKPSFSLPHPLRNKKSENDLKTDDSASVIDDSKSVRSSVSKLGGVLKHFPHHIPSFKKKNVGGSVEELLAKDDIKIRLFEAQIENLTLDLELLQDEIKKEKITIAKLQEELLEKDELICKLNSLEKINQTSNKSQREKELVLLLEESEATREAQKQRIELLEEEVLQQIELNKQLEDKITHFNVSVGEQSILEENKKLRKDLQSLQNVILSLQKENKEIARKNSSSSIRSNNDRGKGEDEEKKTLLNEFHNLQEQFNFLLKENKRLEEEFGKKEFVPSRESSIIPVIELENSNLKSENSKYLARIKILEEENSKLRNIEIEHTALQLRIGDNEARKENQRASDEQLEKAISAAKMLLKQRKISKNEYDEVVLAARRASEVWNS